VRSFDDRGERPVARAYEGRLRSGALTQRTFATRTLVLAVKGNCDGCAALLRTPLEAFGGVPVLVIAATELDEPAWRDSSLDVLVSPSLFAALDIRWPPFWALVDGERGCVLREGVPFGAEQIVADVADLL